MNVKELSGCCIRTIGYDEAVCALRSLNLFPGRDIEEIRVGR